MIIESGLLISFATWLGGKIADKGFDVIYEKLSAKSEIDEKFKECVNSVANKLENRYPDILGNSIAYFFTQEDVFQELCKLLFVNQNVNEKVIAESFDETTLPHEFILEFILELKEELSKELVFQEILANKEIYITIQGISKNVENISSNSSLSYEEIKAIRIILEERFKKGFNPEGFLSLYIKNLSNNIKAINFIGLGIDPAIKKGKRKDLDAIFVKPNFQLISKHHIEEIKNKKISEKKFPIDEKNRFSYSCLFDSPYNYVILGTPGAGKSLLIKSIILNIVEQKKDFRNEQILSSVPFRIELKNYLAFKKKRGGGIIKYLIYSLEDEYSISNILEENINDLLSNNNSILFFDGLDEIFDVSDKINIKNDIENFHNSFLNVKSITTSRFTGYNEAKLDEKKFCELGIMPFTDDQIKEYVSKWYSLEEEHAEIRNVEVLDFFSKMGSIDEELLSNPLLLSLIVILYRNNLKIPDSKLEIYQSCTNTLVDKWDAIKQLDIHIDINILQKKESIFSDLAFWQYQALSSSKPEITFHKAKSAVAKSLVAKKIADEYNCDILANSFLEYAQKRSIYFENNFTHKTFLEYYTAYWIYSNIEKKHKINDRNEIIKKYISNPFWFIVLELLLNMIDKDQPDTEILDGILKDNIENPKSYAFLLYVLPKLKNISEETLISVYSNIIRYIISLRLDTSRNKSKNDLFDRIQKNSINLTQGNIIFKAINRFEIKDRNLTFYTIMEELNFTRHFRKGCLQFDFSEIKKTIHYSEIKNKDPYLFMLTVYNEGDDGNYLENTLNYISLFGVKELFKMQWSDFGGYPIGDFMAYFIGNQMESQNIPSFIKNIGILIEKSLTKKHLFKYILKQDLFLDKESVQTLMDAIFDANISDFGRVLFILVLKKTYSSPFRTERNRKSLASEYKSTPQVRNLMDKITKLENSREILDLVITELDVSDKEILQFANSLPLPKK